MRGKLLLLTVLSMCIYTNGFAFQTENLPSNDTTNVLEENDFFEDDNGKNPIIDIFTSALRFKQYKPSKKLRLNFYNNSPTINVGYGISNHFYERNSFTSKINNNGIIDIKLGSTDLHRVTSNVVEYDNDYLSFSSAENKLNYKENDNSNNYMDLRHIKLGLNNADGYGWNFGGNSHLVLYHSSGINWNSLSFDNNIADSVSINSTKIFGKQLRYGRGFAGGIKLFIINGVAISAEYEQTMTFPRHLFWKDFGSFIIETIAQELSNNFVDEVLDSSPSFAPVIHFLLKNGISYGFYELYKDKMNWPFKTVPPLMNKTYKIGIDFIL
ncbi:MAG: hypothetical protein N3A67_00815 [Ignavibacteria bacterium]|nr:hypothetical protein [Ignavibacteria bacterium]